MILDITSIDKQIKIIYNHLALNDLAHRVELEADAELAQRLGGLDEGPAHVGVLDQPLAVGDAGGLGVADGGGRAGLGGGDDQVGLDGVLAGQGRTHGVARGDNGPTLLLKIVREPFAGGIILVLWLSND